VSDPQLRIAISGASGLVGSALASLLNSEGHEIVALVRRKPDPSAGQVYWNPEIGVVDRDGLEGLDAVVHLAGENIASRRWSAKRKAKLRDSRVVGTTLLTEALATLARPPGVLVSASAIGFYGDRGEETLDEHSAAGTGFLADLAQEWEAAAVAAERAGIRVVKLRVGVVLSASGGALAKMLPPFRLGLGGRLGDGRQIMSWIALADLVRAVRFAIETSAIAGAVNATAPNPASNAEFTRVLGRVLGRPTLFPIPAPALRLIFGEMADEILLGGADVRPRRLEESGFVFEHPDLEGALRSELERD
jgi:uncharacterized protein (TIGR01777 family)